MRIQRQTVCVCHACGCGLYAAWGTNVYSGGHFYCGNCNSDVTIDLYGLGYYGYYVVPSTGEPVFYESLRDARIVSDMFAASLYYAHKFRTNPKIVV